MKEKRLKILYVPKIGMIRTCIFVTILKTFSNTKDDMFNQFMIHDVKM